MDYQKYIDLGFKRTEMNCNIEFKRTGYHGFTLEKKLNDRVMVCVTSGELEKPKLYIKKTNSDTYHLYNISAEAVVDLFTEIPKQNVSHMFTAC